MKKSTDYKAQFCRQYFLELKKFVRSFDVAKDELGMKFLLDAFDYMDKVPERRGGKKRECYWYNGKKEGYGDKELMLSIEEYFSITNVAPYQDLQYDLFEGLMDSDKYLSNDRISTVFKDEKTLLAILSHFGIPFTEDNNYLDDQIKAFVKFAETVAKNDEKESLNIIWFRNALNLYRLCRNQNCHNIIKREVPQRKIAFQFLAFVYIGLTYLLRMAWDTKGDSLESNGYRKPDNFQIPEQNLDIVVKVKDSSDDKIVHYDFVPNYKNGSVRYSKDVVPTDVLNISHQVRKYDKFKLVVRYKNFHSEETKEFGAKGDKMLTYYYWKPTFEIILPEISNLKPGLTNSPSTEMLIAELLDNSNGHQEENETELHNEIRSLLSKLDPVLEWIGKLKENDKRQSEKREFLVDQVNKILLSQKTNPKAEDEIDPSLKKVLNYVDEQKEKEEKRQRLNRNLMRIPIYMIAVFSIVVFIHCLTHDNSLSYLHNKILDWWLPLLLFFISGVFFYIADVRQQKRHFTIGSLGKLARFDLACVVMAFVILVGSRFLVPYRNADEFICSYNFAQYNDDDNAEVVRYMEIIMADNPDDEMVRIKLTSYYLNSGNVKKAVDISRPMRNVKRYKEGSVMLASALYCDSSFMDVKDIIKDYQLEYEDYPDDLRLLSALMLAYGHGKQDFADGVSILNQLANKGNVDAQYHLGYLFSHDMTKWNKGKTEETPFSVDIATYDLPAAILFYRLSEPKKPQASLELGNLFSDLNMVDSAKHYYARAINRLGEGQLKLEALYRMGLLFEKTTPDSVNDYMNDAKQGNYLPAYLHCAIKDKNPDDAILRYKKMGKYVGYRYIPPITFQYIEIGDTIAALKSLKESRPGGRFDMNFVKGMIEMLDSAKVASDPKYGMNRMEKSAAQGCLYAEMVCLFRKIEDNIKGFTSRDAKRLVEISETIPFADVLSSWIYENSANSQMAAIFAQKALGHHPAGALMLSNINVDSLQIMLDNSSSTNVKKRMYLYQYEMAMRIVPEYLKPRCMLYCFSADSKLNSEKKSYPMYRYTFWRDLAIANHNIGLMQLIYFQFLINSGNEDEVLLKALIEGVDNPDNKEYYNDDIIRFLSQKLRDANRNLFKGWIDRHRNNIIISKALSKEQLYKNGSFSLQILPSFIDKRFIMTNQDLLDEFGHLLDDHFTE